MDARKAIREVIESIPNLFGITRGVTIGAEGQTETVLYTQAQVADIIASILPDALKTKGHLMIALLRSRPTVLAVATFRCRSPRVRGPKAKCGSLRVATRVAIANTPSVLPMRDVPALAAALMAAHTTWRPGSQARA